MNLATIGLCMAMEYLLADYTLRFTRVVPVALFEGKRYLVLQFADWHIGTPFVNWLAPWLIRRQNTGSTDVGDVILLDDNTSEIRRITPDYKNRVELNFNFMYYSNNPSELLYHDSNAYTLFFQQEQYDKLVEMYNQFINKDK